VTVFRDEDFEDFEVEDVLVVVGFLSVGGGAAFGSGVGFPSTPIRIVGKSGNGGMILVIGIGGNGGCGSLMIPQNRKKTQPCDPLCTGHTGRINLWSRPPSRSVVVIAETFDALSLMVFVE